MTRWQHCAAIALGILSVCSACSVSRKEEREMGAADAASVDSQMPLVRDSAVNRYITTLGRSMASRTSRADLDWHFAVVNSPEVNAFALPGGFVYVNRGAIEQADRMDGLEIRPSSIRFRSGYDRCRPLQRLRRPPKAGDYLAVCFSQQ
jgi:predicted Zn-dependent protease